MTLTIDTQKIAHLRQALQKNPAQKKFCVQTFGCQMNHADSEKIHMLLAQAGLSKVDTWEEADIIIFNTCSVRQKGEDKVFGYVEEIDKLRHKTGRDIKVGLTGCMTRKTGLNKKYYDYIGRQNTTKITLTQVAEKIDTPTLYNSDDDLFHRVDTMDFVVRIEEIGSLTTLLSIMYSEDIGQDDNFQSYLRVKQERNTSKSANVIIQTGCDNYCTFCIVPYTRGHEISRPQEEIVQECVETVVRDGAKEVTLLGQNVNSYGKEMRKALWNSQELTWFAPTVRTPFRELLEKLNVILGLDRIRFTSSNPHDMTRDILDAHFDLEKCCHYLHFALQSGDNDLLKKMNRKHSYDDFKSQVEYLRSRDLLFGISTDVIVGFPGETEEQFENTMKAFRECQFDYAYIARYSPRKETYAAKMPGHVPAEIKAQRWDRLNTLMYEIIQERNQLMIGREEVILVSKIDEENGTISGRTRNFREVFIEKNEKIILGDLVPVKILELDRWVLRGQLL
ncbi:MiaB/RimO family radical SAM methylthiotransferase [Candidatus Gracilibacteria bacterium]|nr:MiaB/RimO family radical SAM methylthiotransferase [Candidatus Gracilibacteria bacterium]